MPRKPKPGAGASHPIPKAKAKRSKATKPKAAAKASKKQKAAPAVILKTAEGIEAPQVKRAAWRPSEYRPEYCDLVVAAGRDGKSKAWMAATIGVVRNTLDNWARAYPEFLSAMEYAREAEQLWWEDAGQRNLETTGFCQNVWSRSMAARFPKDWRESKQIDHGVTDALAALMAEIDGNGASLL